MYFGIDHGGSTSTAYIFVYYSSSASGITGQLSRRIHAYPVIDGSRRRNAIADLERELETLESLCLRIPSNGCHVHQRKRGYCTACRWPATIFARPVPAPRQLGRAHAWLELRRHVKIREARCQA